MGNEMDLIMSAAVNSEKISDTKTAVNKVTDYIKHKIIYKELKPNDKIPTESELSEILNVSRSSVREALKILGAINIIQIRRGDGTYISEPEDISFSQSLLFKMILNNMQLKELVEFREQIEVAIVKLAITYATKEDIQGLKNIHNSFLECIETNPDDYKMIHELDLRFHKALATSTKNKLMAEIYLFAFEIFSPMILENYAIGQIKGDDKETTVENHRILIEALEKKDLYTGIYGIQMSLKLWMKWINNRDSDITSSKKNDTF
ncbi:FadR/GntR family transcriptional regulator [Bacillus haynesii]|uniref:FadR/GntR family transcriptional regulator n=1 Tax=Bacillus haynesii TaxID=1925021 RepID=UPI001C240ACC|nr:GntR family transcriptional regulator [Bacillus haynesii]MBU8685565.1 GntR family transcriptional regulator [Bacillus haynesii]